jgi:hypothetical protein
MIEKSRLLATIHRSFASVFPHVTVWPGTLTLFIGSPGRQLDLPLDSLVRRLADLPCQPAFLSPPELRNRFQSLRLERLQRALAVPAEKHTVYRPTLAHRQAIYQSYMIGSGQSLLEIAFRDPVWLRGVAGLLLLFFILTAFKRRGLPYPRFLFFTAGVASLTLELLSFYMYQATAGTLYSEMALLIGAFMLGLSTGTSLSSRAARVPCELPALVMLLAATLLFAATCSHIPHQAILPYHLMFLFATAMATGSLFVGATRRYFELRPCGSRGAGYAWELLGSSLGALLTITAVLPALGVNGVLAAVAVTALLALLGTLWHYGGRHILPFR